VDNDYVNAIQIDSGILITHLAIKTIEHFKMSFQRCRNWGKSHIQQRSVLEV